MIQTCAQSLCVMLLFYKGYLNRSNLRPSEFYRIQYLRIDNECFDRDGNLVLSEMKKNECLIKHYLVFNIFSSALKKPRFEDLKISLIIERVL